MLSYVLNPGAVILGFCIYSYLIPESPFPSFLSSQPVLYFAFIVGIALMGFNLYRVFVLSKRLKVLKSANT